MKTKLFFISLFSILSIVLSSCAAQPAATVGATSSPADTGGSNKAEVIISGFAFQPATLTVKAGTEVTWTNQDSAGHNVTNSSGSELDSSLIAQNASWSHVFTTPGTYEYHCGVHPSMVGTIIVTP